MLQQKLFVVEPSRPTRRRGALDSDSEDLLSSYLDILRHGGTTERTVRNEASQIRALCREAGSSEAMPLRELMRGPADVARALTRPREPIARSTGLKRLRAIQRFIRTVPGATASDADQFESEIDKLLAPTSRRTWDLAPVLVAGQRARRRPQGTVLFETDIRAIEAAARSPTSGVVVEAIVSLCCRSALELEELVALQWSQFKHEADATYVVITRRGRQVELLVDAPAAIAISRLPGKRTGYVFPSRRSASGHLTTRAASKMLLAASRGAGLRRVGHFDLRKAFAYSLRTRGFSVGEVAVLVGITRASTVDSWLLDHRAINAQRRIRELPGRPSGVLTE